MSVKRVLNLGLDAPEPISGVEIIHRPIIQVVPRSKNDPDIQKMINYVKGCTHLIFTSKMGVRIFCEYMSLPEGISCICVGKKTAAALKECGYKAAWIADTETAEGVVELLRKLDLRVKRVCWPHSALSRSVIASYLEEMGIEYKDCVLYDTLVNQEFQKVDMDGVDEIVFTSSSTVDAFVEIFGGLPQDKVLTPIGPVTAGRIDQQQRTDFNEVCGPELHSPGAIPFHAKCKSQF